MKRQPWQEQCQLLGPRRGALEMVPCDIFTNDLEEDVPSEVSSQHVTLDLSGW